MAAEEPPLPMPSGAGSELFQRAAAIFLALRDLGPGERDEAVGAACRGDAALADLVQILLVGDAAPFPAEAMAENIRAVSDTFEASELGFHPTDSNRIGPYRLLERLGEGGFGIVFLAEQEAPIRRQVALKIIKLGMDTRQVIARFESERQALALMDHPNIAKVLDAGATATGRPFFVMELVRGEPITTYCDRRRLAIPDRLRLFKDVCDAVHHAHQKGVIHRDIKPSNVLVSELGVRHVPKVIDFGIAKATTARLTEKTIFTELRQMIGTPEYMSPEQAGSSPESVDTRSDVYSLGVLLYELLAGATPFNPQRLRSAAYAEVQRIIREEDPPRPSTRLSSLDNSASAAAVRSAEPLTLRKLLRGELDWIAMRSIEKDPARRYDSPLAMAADIERFLSGDPVLAAPPSVTYVAGKFVRRHRSLVAAALAVLVALVGGLIGTTLALQRARTAEAEAVDAKGREELRRIEAEARSYEANIAAAQAALALHEPVTVRQRLDRCPEALRGWEWRWLLASCDDSIEACEHGARVSHALFSPDERLLATRGIDHRLTLHDATTGALVREFRTKNEKIGRMGFSPNGSLLASSIEQDELTVWNVATGARGPTIKASLGRWIESVQFSSDAKRIIATGPDGEIIMVDAATGAPISLVGPRGALEATDAGLRVLQPAGDGTWTVRDDGGAILATLDRAISGWPAGMTRDGRLVLFGRSGTLQLFDAVSGARRSEFASSEGELFDHAFSPDTKLLVTSTKSRGAELWDTDTGVRRARLVGHIGRIDRVRFSPDGMRLLTSGEDRTLRLWDGATGAPISVMRGHDQIILYAAFLPDEGRVLSVANDRTVRVWDMATGAEIGVWLGIGRFVDSCIQSRDGRRLVTNSDDGVSRIWDLSLGQPRVTLRSEDERGPLPIVLDPVAGERMLLPNAQGVATLFDPLSGREVGPTTANASASDPLNTPVLFAWREGGPALIDSRSGSLTAALPGASEELTSHAFSRDRSRVAYGTKAGTVRVCDVPSGQLRATLPGAATRTHHLRFLADPDRLITAAEDGPARLWSISGQRELSHIDTPARGHPPWVVTVAPDGVHVLLGGLIWPMHWWNTATGEHDTLKASFDDDVTGALYGVVGTAFSADGTRFATASQDGTARVWESPSARELRVLRGHTGPVHCVAFHPDGSRLASGSWDQTIRLWDPTTGREVAVLAGHAKAVHNVAFSADGKRLFSASADLTIRVWDTLPLRERR